MTARSRAVKSHDSHHKKGEFSLCNQLPCRPRWTSWVTVSDPCCLCAAPGPQLGSSCVSVHFTSTPSTDNGVMSSSPVFIICFISASLCFQDLCFISFFLGSFELPLLKYSCRISSFLFKASGSVIVMSPGPEAGRCWWWSGRPL